MSGRSRRTALERAWAFLCSRQVTAVLLLAIGALLIVSLALPQMPAEADAAGREAWWSTTGERFGPNADWMAGLGLFTLFGTPLFIALLSALLLNNLACTLARLGRLWREITRRPTTRLPEAAYHPTGERLSDGAGRPLGAAAAARAMWRRGYRHSKPSAPGEGDWPLYFYSSPRLAPLGTLLGHLGLFLLALAALLHTQLAWRERLVLDPAAEAAALQQRPGCSVRSDVLAAGAERGALLGGEVRLVTAEGGHAAAGWVSPGAPLAACGTRLHYVGAYGLVLGVEAVDKAGAPVAVLPPGPPTLRFGGEETVNHFEVPAWGWSVTVVPSPEALAGSPEGRLALQVVSASEALTASLRVGEGWAGPWGRLRLVGGQIVEVEAVSDPGAAPFLAGGAALGLGSAFALLCPRRRRWARLEADGTLWEGHGPAEGEVGGEIGGRGTP